MVFGNNMQRAVTVRDITASSAEVYPGEATQGVYLAGRCTWVVYQGVLSNLYPPIDFFVQNLFFLLRLY